MVFRQAGISPNLVTFLTRSWIIILACGNYGNLQSDKYLLRSIRSIPIMFPSRMGVELYGARDKDKKKKKERKKDILPLSSCLERSNLPCSS